MPFGYVIPDEITSIISDLLAMNDIRLWEISSGLILHRNEPIFQFNGWMWQEVENAPYQEFEILPFHVMLTACGSLINNPIGFFQEPEQLALRAVDSNSSRILRFKEFNFRMGICSREGKMLEYLNPNGICREFLSDNGFGIVKRSELPLV